MHAASAPLFVREGSSAARHLEQLDVRRSCRCGGGACSAARSVGGIRSVRGVDARHRRGDGGDGGGRHVRRQQRRELEALRCV
jgi:hypothetical protein